jgi:tRNA G18 (ribose-2'-O)-methylase SpoU
MEEHYLGKLTIPAHVKIEITTKEELKKITGYKMHQGIMAIGVKPPNTPLEEMEGPAVVLNGIADSENVGAIVRNAVAFGIRNLIVDTHSSPPYLRRSIKVSRGTLFQMNVHITNNLPLLLKQKNGVATSLRPLTIPLDEVILPNDPYFIFGRESTGIDQEVLDTVSLHVKIPIDRGVDSLNVAVASGIVLYNLMKKSKS